MNDKYSLELSLDELELLLDLFVYLQECLSCYLSEEEKELLNKLIKEWGSKI